MNGNPNTARWTAALQKIPELNCECFEDNGKVVLSSNESVDETVIRDALKEFMPWRKGPWKILGVDIDTEWRSNLKWDRLAPHFDFRGKKVLDIGCGNGYYCYRATLAGASYAVGIDPSLYSVYQAQIAAKLCPQIPVKVLAVAQKDFKATAFDTVFSMGVIYHHKNPIEHLSQIHDMLNDGGTLIFETLVVEPDGLIPNGRYAKMRNVYQIPSVEGAKSMLAAVGFKDICLSDISKTTFAEQRRTEWMVFDSLEDFLDADCTKTVEGYPAPVRAMFHARR